MRVASIDLGSNSFHMAIIELKKGHINVIDRQKEKLRLVSKKNVVNINGNPYITDSAILKIIDTIQKFKNISELYNAKIIAVATSAIREAANAEEIEQRVYNSTGVKIDIISPYEEGRLAYMGAIYSLDCYDKDATVIDIGGGSLQICRGKSGNIKKIKSYKMGVIRLTENYFEEGFDREKQKELINFIESQLEPVENYFINSEVYIGVSGTIENIARLCNKVSKNGDSNGLIINYENLDEIFKKLPDLLKDETIFEFVDYSRKDTIISGIILLKLIFEIFRIKKLVFSAFSIKEGNVISLIKKKYLSNIRHSSTKHLFKKINIDKIHVKNVSKFALYLFDILKNTHKLDKNWRDYLFTASILHDIGKIISFNNHQDHSEYIIINSQILGYTEREKKIISKVAKYHKNQNIDNEPYEIKVLSGILRIADSLDKSGFSLFKEAKLDIRSKKLFIVLQDGKMFNVFNYFIEQKKKLIVETLKIEIEVTISR
ncbi:MAG: Ppx/GppA family phosphatase [Spirochaetes bacterium]|nr:Ppx/GppA family phosphatase [Spirochaetota bacterium]